MNPPNTRSVVVELTADTAAHAAAAVEHAVQTAGLAARGWRVRGPADPGEPRRLIEVLAPAGTDLRRGWNAAHALTEALAARPELAAIAEAELDHALTEIDARIAAEVREAPGTELSINPPPRWHLAEIGAERAWQHGHGHGVRIGHPDSGTTEHPSLAGAAVLHDQGLNLMEPGSPPIDPLAPVGQPGHGTATSSLMVGRERLPHRVVGLAPAAELVPIRVTDSVVILTWHARLAQAIDHAVARGCHVVSLSLGGLPGARLRRAVERAHARGVIVVAAAGNHVQFVVWPAAYPEVLAVAATGPKGQVWSDSSKGPSVALTAPGHRMLVADWRDGDAVTRISSGTSYATALVASAAALWLARHDPVALRQRYPGAALPQAFRRALAGSTRDALDPGPFPRAWFGAGLLDCAALLQAPLPLGEEAPGATPPAAPEAMLVDALLPLALERARGRTGPHEAIVSAHAQTRSVEQRVRLGVAHLLGAGAREDLTTAAPGLGVEVLQQLVVDPVYRRALVDAVLGESPLPAVPRHASMALRRRIADTTAAPARPRRRVQLAPTTATTTTDSLRIVVPITLEVRLGAPEPE
ncbi:S8 family serine peptidase [Nannocystis bainbridge]|uniref:S8 family serine peptidase n=1 Tax=Nannocystis bainbridge TaxID=2995303 RepID=A0ABT5EBC8_9BACT|nr:S8 family serine peptidase [Nannocystis bainbridge]MDC0723169.1 S8 family serine peptidase [Nannocystis bainbridge]